jgi:3',5'-cyclic-AMP phosphodiesterase
VRVLDIDDEPFHALEFLEAAPGGERRQRRLPFLRGRVDELPASLDAVILAADLQGRALPELHAPEGLALPLVGEAVADELHTLAQLEQLPPPERVGVVLAGDLYAAPDARKRGATGDVRSVWQAFARRGFRWVVGVAGNHDLFGSPAEHAALRREPGIHVLDGERVRLDGLDVAGVSGVVGKPGKTNRRALADLDATVRTCLHARPHMLVLHEGPTGSVDTQRGNVALRELLRRQAVLVVCGHVHWAQPLAALEGGGQVVNADGRVIVLQR